MQQSILYQLDTCHDGAHTDLDKHDRSEDHDQKHGDQEQSIDHGKCFHVGMVDHTARFHRCRIHGGVVRQRCVEVWLFTETNLIQFGSMVVLWDSTALGCNCLQTGFLQWCCETVLCWGVTVDRDKSYSVWVHGGVVIQYCVGVWPFTETRSTVLWDSIALGYDCLHRQISFSHFILSDVKQSADFKVTTLGKCTHFKSCCN